MRTAELNRIAARPQHDVAVGMELSGVKVRRRAGLSHGLQHDSRSAWSSAANLQSLALLPHNLKHDVRTWNSAAADCRVQPHCHTDSSTMPQSTGSSAEANCIAKPSRPSLP